MNAHARRKVVRAHMIAQGIKMGETVTKQVGQEVKAFGVILRRAGNIAVVRRYTKKRELAYVPIFELGGAR